MISKSTIVENLKKGNLKQAIEELTCLGEKYDADLYNIAILQSGRLASLQKDETMGTISFEQGSLMKNRIQSAITSIVNDNVEDNWEITEESDKRIEAQKDRDITVILFVAANPKDSEPLALGQEVNRIESGLDRSKNRDKFSLEQQWATQIKDLRRAMLKYKPTIVHFSGHGSTVGRITLEDSEGFGHEVGVEALGNFFSLFKDRVQCVVLNACYAENQAKEIASHINYVIGMNDEIPDEAAIEFSEAFYDALGAGEDIQFAFNLAVNAIDQHGLDAEDIPVLIKREH